MCKIINAALFLNIFILTFCTKNKETIVATWKGVIIAETQDHVIVEGNKYFPMDSIKKEYFSTSDTTTACVWKGTANYFDINVNGKVNKDAAWTYLDPKPAAENIKGMIAFWKGVHVKSKNTPTSSVEL